MKVKITNQDKIIFTRLYIEKIIKELKNNIKEIKINLKVITEENRHITLEQEIACNRASIKE